MASSLREGRVSPMSTTDTVQSPAPVKRVASDANPILTASLNSPTVLKTDPLSSPAALYAGFLLRLGSRAGQVGKQRLAGTDAQPPTPSRCRNDSEGRLFECPACKKRFQRHIALSAHFRNQHLAAVPSPGQLQQHPIQLDSRRICRLCSFVADDVDGVRTHLLNRHRIDLTSPLACLVSPAEDHHEQLEEDRPTATSTASAPPSPASPTSPSQGWPDSQKENDDPIQTSDHVDKACAASRGRQSTLPSPSPSPLSSPSVSPSSPSPPASPSSSSSSPRVKRPSGCPIIDTRSSLASLTEAAAATLTTAVTTTTATAMKTKSAPRSAAKRACRSGVEVVWRCHDCAIVFPNQTLYFLHRGFHSDNSPWRCNGCGRKCADSYDFNAHLVSDPHG